MRKNSLRIACTALTMMVATSSVFASSTPTTPVAPATPQTTTSAPYQVCPKQTKEQAPSSVFVIDNFKIIQTTLDKLGITPDELDQMIKEGKNLKQVLETKNISIKKFKKYIIKEYYKVIDQGVKDKQITCTQGDMLKKAVKEKVMGWLNNK